MDSGYLLVNQSLPLSGTVELSGAKNAVLVTIASLLLTRGISTLRNVPLVADVFGMIDLLRVLNARVVFDEQNHELTVDTTLVDTHIIPADIMHKMRTSVLAMGPLLASCGNVVIKGKPGGCPIGARAIDYHLKNFIKMGVTVTQEDGLLKAHVNHLQAQRIVFEYPSVGATENIMMLATKTPGITYIVNAALEPEVFDLIEALKKMGARITIQAPATLMIEGVSQLQPIEHTIMYDRLEAGSLLLATAATGGCINLPHACADHMDVFLIKLQEMGHTITVGPEGKGIALQATTTPKAVSFKTGPFPGFPTDLQAPMMALQCTASGTSVVEETVFENRFMHVEELQKMGACIDVIYNKAVITGVPQLHGQYVNATDIRASMALVIAGLAAQGTTSITGVHHWKRGYNAMENKLALLGANIKLFEKSSATVQRELSMDSNRTPFNRP